MTGHVRYRLARRRLHSMKSRNLATNDRNMTTSNRSGDQKKRGKNGPSLTEIRQRALEIHVERGRDDSDLENYLAAWLQAEDELRKKYNKSSGDTKFEAEGDTNASAAKE